MKKSIAGVILLLSISFFTLNSCKKTVTDDTSTTLNVIQNDPSTTIFSAIESRAGDDAVINNSRTVLIPVDSAFTSAGISLSSVATLNTSTCDSIVKYYSLPSTVIFNGNSNAQVSNTSNLGLSIFADSTLSATYFDGIAALSQTATMEGTAAVYKLTQYVNLPSASVSQITAADSSLSLFNEAFNRTNFASTIAAGSYTLFMPSNSAFINAGYPDIASIDAADLNTLTQILMYNTVASDFFDNDLLTQTTLTTLQGENVQLQASGGSLVLLGNSDPGSPASLLNNGTLAGNIITYKTNNVLLP